MSDSEISIILSGTTISPGLAEGTTHLYIQPLGPLDIPKEIKQHNPDKELGRLNVATIKISEDLFDLATRVEKEIDSKLAEVFEVHQLILKDSSLKRELQKEIVENLVSASSAVKTVFLRWEKRFLLMESHIAKGKGDDLRDISIRLRNALAGIKIHPLDEIPFGSVLVTSRLLPSDTIFLANRSTSAVLLEYGSIGSHAALFVREMGLPCISGFKNLLQIVPGNLTILVDANSGSVTIRPSETEIALFRKKVAELERTYQMSQLSSMGPAITKDNVRIFVFANVGSNEDTEKAMSNGAEGVGLYRMERAYLGRINPPNVDELIEEMRHTLIAAKGYAVCVRLLDIGADKPLPFMNFFAETNPSLGQRGIRLLRNYPELLTTLLKAILELSREFDISILIPMVTVADDVAVVRGHLTRLGSELNLNVLPRLGAMIETPAAALSAKEFAPYIDFFSFGTNDLTQYAFAADRENAAVEHYFNDTSDVIFKLLSLAYNDAPDIALHICGALAGRPEQISRLLKCGIRTFSVAPSLIPIIKETIRNSFCTL